VPGNGHVFSKCTGPAEIGGGNSYDFATIAQIHLASAAVETLSAKDGGVERNVFAGLKTSHRAANSLDDSSGFMPHNDRWKTPSRASVVSMHVASADATRQNANENVVLAGLRLRHIDEVKLLVFRENERFHGLSSLSPQVIQGERAGPADGQTPSRNRFVRLTVNT
jgi:hypothetical protein